VLDDIESLAYLYIYIILSNTIFLSCHSIFLSRIGFRQNSASLSRVRSPIANERVLGHRDVFRFLVQVSVHGSKAEAVNAIESVLVFHRTEKALDYDLTCHWDLYQGMPLSTTPSNYSIAL
jgi:hypothetical protein